MLTYTMTMSELAREVGRDAEWIERWVRAQSESRVRWMWQEAKRGKFPIVWQKEVIVPRSKQPWTVVVTGDDAVSLRMGYVGVLMWTECPTEQGGWDVIKVQPILGRDGSAQGFGLMILTPHVFRRYRERTGLPETMKRKQIVSRFMRRNTRFTETNFAARHRDAQVQMATEEGVVFGRMVWARVIYVKTFVTYQMERPWQAERFREGRERVERDPMMLLHDVNSAARGLRQMSADVERFEQLFTDGTLRDLDGEQSASELSAFDRRAEQLLARQLEEDTDPTPDPIPADAPTRSLSPTMGGQRSFCGLWKFTSALAYPRFSNK